MKGCLTMLGALAGVLVLFLAYFFLIVNPRIEEEVRQYRGLVMAYKPNHERYIHRLTGLAGKLDAHDVTPPAAIIGPAMKVVAFSLDEPEARQIVQRLSLLETGRRSLSSWTNMINDDACRWSFDTASPEWDVYTAEWQRKDLEQVVGKIENEGDIASWRGYSFTLLHNKDAGKGILMIRLLY